MNLENYECLLMFLINYKGRHSFIEQKSVDHTLTNTSKLINITNIGTDIMGLLICNTQKDMVSLL